MITDGVDGNDGVDGAGGVNHGDGVVVDHDGGLVTHSFKSGPSPAYFHLFLVFFKQMLQFLQQCNVKKLSIQYPVLGFEPTTSRIRVSSHNH